MKKLFLSLTALALLFTGCSEDEDSVAAIKTPIVGEISGDITSSKTYAFGNYTLSGIVKIQSGVTLTFEAGSRITADKSNGTDALVVLNGGKLIVNGTAGEPVVFTESSQVPGSWGGIIMYGDAPIVGASSATSATAEDGVLVNGLPLTYGGTNATHNGGSLKYVRVEYAGKKISDGTSEMNGFSFYSVGSGTVLQNLVSYKGADDGYEFYGGTVSATNLISYGNYDDSFDWQDGWKGQLNSNWYAYQTGTGNFGMEIEAKTVDNIFYPVISGITLKRASGTVVETPGEYDAIQFKKQGNGDFTNILVDGYTDGVFCRIQDSGTNTSQVSSGKIKLTNVKINGTTPQTGYGGSTAFTITFPTGNFTTSTTSTGANLTNGAWSTVNGATLLQ
jgi:hypothetical protein